MLLLMAVSLVAFMAILVLAIDSGALQRQRRMAQAAADAGALAGAIEVFRNRTDAATVEASARKETERNGFADGTGGVSVSVIYPTTSTNSPGSDFVKVVIQQTVPTIFRGFLGFTSVAMRTQAVGGLGASNMCLVVTEPSGSGSLDVRAGGLVAGTRCGVAVNSTSSNAVNLQGNGEVAASTIAVVGPQSKPQDATGVWVSGVPPTPDPLAYLRLQPSDTSGACNNGTYGFYQNVTTSTLTPGVYCGGITLDHQSVTFNPGLYVIKGGGFTMKHATATGNGVTFVDMNAPAANGGASNFAPFDFSVNSSASFTAMSSGSLAGILFYVDPSAPSTNAGGPIVNSLGSNAMTTYNGSIYIPNQGIDLSSSATLTVNGGIVARTVAAKTGNGDIIINGVSGGAGNYALKKAVIIE
jgi:hypothetical protein